MIQATDAVFPNNVVDILATRLTAIDPDVLVFRRLIKSSDPIQCIGVCASTWVPKDDSVEMRGPEVSMEPTLQTYTFMVQTLVRDMDEERGLATQSVLDTSVRRMLYRDRPLHVGLSALSASVAGSTETTKRWGIQSQRFLNGVSDGYMNFLSTLEFWLETETE